MIIKPSFKGKVKCILKDEQGNIKQETGYVGNKITDNFLDRLFTSVGTNWLNWESYGAGSNHRSIIGGYRTWNHRYGLGIIHGCRIGNGTTPTTRDMNSLETTLSSSPDEKNNSDRSAQGLFPAFVERQFVFYAGNGTGSVNEVGVWPGEGDMAARVILPETIEKLETDILEVFYKIEFDIPQRHYSGTIVNGQIDGTTDINWDLYITDDMIYNCWIKTHLGYYGSGSGGSVYTCHNALGSLFDLFRSVEDKYSVIIGDSNAPSDIENDSGSGTGHLKGAELFNGEFVFIEPDPYVEGSYQRTGRVGFEEDIANVEVAEMLIFASLTDKGSPAFRITFDPALNNQELYRLYLDFTVSLGTIS